jgi:hypothetical protein
MHAIGTRGVVGAAVEPRWRPPSEPYGRIDSKRLLQVSGRGVQL